MIHETCLQPQSVSFRIRSSSKGTSTSTERSLGDKMMPRPRPGQMKVVVKLAGLSCPPESIRVPRPTPVAVENAVDGTFGGCWLCSACSTVNFATPICAEPSCRLQASVTGVDPDRRTRRRESQAAVSGSSSTSSSSGHPSPTPAELQQWASRSNSLRLASKSPSKESPNQKRLAVTEGVERKVAKRQRVGPGMANAARKPARGAGRRSETKPSGTSRRGLGGAHRIGAEAPAILRAEPISANFAAHSLLEAIVVGVEPLSKSTAVTVAAHDDTTSEEDSQAAEPSIPSWRELVPLDRPNYKIVARVAQKLERMARERFAGPEAPTSAI